MKKNIMAETTITMTTNDSGLAFVKMHGTGNDFVMVNAADLNGFDPEKLARNVCDRRFGIGSDGLISVGRGSGEHFIMRMWNPDGSESEMCGNGIRCFAKYVCEFGLTSEPVVSVETGAGLLRVRLLDDGRVEVDMGLARRAPRDIGIVGISSEEFVNQPIDFPEASLRGTAISMGNPHLVFFVDNVATVPLEVWGPKLEHHDLFPNRVNVHFVQPISDKRLRMRTWERGAGITLACGTGACAVGVAGFLTSHSDRQVAIELPGGELEINYLTDGRVLMTGPAETVFVGNWPAEL